MDEISLGLKCPALISENIFLVVVVVCDRIEFDGSFNVCVCVP